jgi:hypothetical protein
LPSFVCNSVIDVQLALNVFNLETLLALLYHLQKASFDWWDQSYVKSIKEIKDVNNFKFKLEVYIE